MAAPDVIHVEVRDPAFVRGTILHLEEPRGEANGTWIQNEQSSGLVIGPRRDYLRLADKPPQLYFDRDSVDDADAYAPVGGRRVVSVHRKSMPYDAGIFPSSGGDTRSGASFKHDIYLKLDGDLQAGRHLIRWPRHILEDTEVDFDDRSTRASSIHATQTGHRPIDLGKVAYLSLWLPGGPDNGAVDFFSDGVDSFEVVDETGQAVFTAPIRLRAAPDMPEPGNGLGHDLQEFTGAASARVPLVGLHDGTFTSATPHGFLSGQRIALERLGGDMDAGALFGTVTALNEHDFSVSDLSAELPDHLSAGATASPTHRANRAGTFVFELDYSAWQPTQEGAYHLRIPRIGISDEIPIANDVWRKAAESSLAGLYHHRSGVALDGRYGYSRPIAFRPGAEMTIRESRLPLIWTSEFPGGFIPFEDAAGDGWISERVAPSEYWGGYMDAGDWDRRVQHLEIPSLLLEVFEDTPTEKLFRTKLPKSSESLDKALYHGTDDLPDLVHEAIWSLDFFRRMQMPDGSIRGGIESAGHPLRGEPSFLEHQPVFAYAPDHVSSYSYAAAAAKIARILGGLGAVDLAAVYSRSAEEAWIAAERGYADPDAFYADAIQAGRAAHAFDEISWESRKHAMQATAADYRVAAAASLQRLTGSAPYRKIIEGWWATGPHLAASRADAGWDYLMSKDADPAISDAIKAALLHQAKIILEAQDGLSYPALKHPGAPAGWGQGGAPGYSELMLLIRAHELTGDPMILRALERAHHAMLGANQLGQSLVTGAGTDPVRNILHEDRLAMGVEPPSGITIYGWASQGQTAHGWIFGPPWSPLPEVGTAEHAAQRRIEPPRFSLPTYEYLVEHPAVVMQAEYTVQQTIAPMAALALYLHAQ